MFSSRQSRVKLLVVSLNGLFVVMLVWMLSRLDVDSVRQYWQQAHLGWLGIGLAVYGLSVWFKVERFRLVTGHFGHRLSLADSGFIQMIGTALALLTPGRIGEATKIYFLHRQHVPAWRGTALVLFERLFDFLVLAGAGLVFSLMAYPQPALIIALGCVVVLVGLAILFFQQLYRLERLIPKKFHRLLETIRELEVTRRRALSRIVLITIVCWGLEGLFHWFTFLAIGVPVSVWAATGILAVSTLAGILSFLPSGFGAFELSAIFLYGLVGVSAEAAALVVAVTRLLGIVTPCLVAIVLVNLRGESLTSIRAGTKAMSGMSDQPGTQT